MYIYIIYTSCKHIYIEMIFIEMIFTNFDAWWVFGQNGFTTLFDHFYFVWETKSWDNSFWTVQLFKF